MGEKNPKPQPRRIGDLTDQQNAFWHHQGNKGELAYIGTRVHLSRNKFIHSHKNYSSKYSTIAKDLKRHKHWQDQLQEHIIGIINRGPKEFSHR